MTLVTELRVVKRIPVQEK